MPKLVWRNILVAHMSMSALSRVVSCIQCLHSYIQVFNVVKAMAEIVHLLAGSKGSVYAIVTLACVSPMEYRLEQLLKAIQLVVSVGQTVNFDAVR